MLKVRENRPIGPRTERAVSLAVFADSIDIALAEMDLLEFIKLLWPILEPATPLVEGWALSAVCEHLEAVTAGQIKRLLMNVPPGFMKSLTTNVFWPAWEWGPKYRPTERYLTFSYSATLTERDNLRMLNLLRSPEYQRYWGDRYQLTHDGVTKLANDKMGWKLASSVGGVGTGERGSRVLIDDPNNVRDAESATIRGNANTWFSEVVQSRVQNITEDAFVVIMQRTHEDDVSGTILAGQYGYEHLLIPMEYDAKRRKTTSIGFRDPRSKEGELAWPERFPASEVSKLKVNIGPYAYAAQYQQSPTPRGGGIIQRDWWQPWPAPGFEPPPGRPVTFPRLDYVVASFDGAYGKTEENDHTALTVWGVWEDKGGAPKVILLEAWAESLKLHEAVQKTLDSCRRRQVDEIVIEEKATGISVIQEIKRLMAAGEFRVTGLNPQGDKTARAHAVVPLFTGGLIFAPPRPWAETVIEQCASFPKGSRDDLVDTVTQVLRHLRRLGLLKLADEHSAQVTHDLTLYPDLPNTYVV